MLRPTHPVTMCGLLRPGQCVRVHTMTLSVKGTTEVLFQFPYVAVGERLPAVRYLVTCVDDGWHWRVRSVETEQESSSAVVTDAAISGLLTGGTTIGHIVLFLLCL